MLLGTVNESGMCCSTEKLILAMARGETSALAKLYSETRSAVYGFALSVLKNAQDAEDCLQEVYIKLWKNAGSYKPLGKPMAFILTVTKNEAMSRLRARSRTTTLDDDQWQLFYVESPAVTSEDRAVLSAAMRGLGDEERQVVMLHAVAGLKHTEIASLLGSPLSTVLSRYSRALKKLQKLIGGEFL